MKSITWKIGGEAGFGIMTTGLMFSRLAVRHGYHVFDYVEYPSLIRGGHNVFETRVSDEKVFSQEKKTDFLFALNRETINLHKANVKKGGIIVYDPGQFEFDETLQDIETYPLPFSKITTSIGALKVMENNVAMGATLALLSMDLNILFGLIEETFSKKGAEVVDKNKAAAQAGYDYVKKNPPKNFKVELMKIPQKEQKMLLTGNEAMGLGAICSGCKFFVAYPMTPMSSLMHFMAEYGEKYGVVVKHAEDEISVINMAIGASYAGVRTMTGTAGGGFSLMVEGLGLSGITETPLVIGLGQRPGPATGMPTWTGQGDLQFILHAAQDEFPRIILAPGDAAEAFYLTRHAFNFAEVFQCPVFVLSDKYLAESHSSESVFENSKIGINRGKLIPFKAEKGSEEYLRYKLTSDGIPQRAVPGMKGYVFTANSYEHNEYGYSTEEAVERKNQVDRRAKKMEAFRGMIPGYSLYGDNSSDLTVIGWGSTKGPVLQALSDLKEEGFTHKINFLHMNCIWPFPKEVGEILSRSKKSLLIEGNSYGQLGLLIREQTGYLPDSRYLKYDGRPFYPEDVIQKIKEELR